MQVHEILLPITMSSNEGSPEPFPLAKQCIDVDEDSNANVIGVAGIAHLRACIILIVQIQGK